MTGPDFLSVEDHFLALVDRMAPRDKSLYESFKHTRTETAFCTRNFVVYEMHGRLPKPIDRIIVNDFSVDEASGASTEILSMETKQTLIVGYEPVKVFDHDVFIWMPLHTKLRWSADRASVPNGSLGFPICVRTKSRLHLRERSVIYMETGPSFGQEFDTDSLK